MRLPGPPATSEPRAHGFSVRGHGAPDACDFCTVCNGSSYPTEVGWKEATKVFRAAEEEIPLVSGNLAGVKAYDPPFHLGVAKATEETLAEITEALSDHSMEWLHGKNFGSSFR